MNPEQMRALVAVGSRSDRVCSVGAFARAEAKALEKVFLGVEILEPDAGGAYPICTSVIRPDVVFYHAPSLHDRKRPWNALTSALILRRAFPKARFVPIVHEYSEAPAHWKARQAVILKMSSAAVVNSEADFRGAHRWQPRMLRSHLGPTLFFPELISTASASETGEARLLAARTEARDRVVARFGASHGLAATDKWVLHPGLVTPGKGVNFLSRLEPVLSAGARLVVMGGLGPKARDQRFARATIAALREAMRGRLSFIESPSDDVFRDLLLAADLVVLPYDAGVSERRSSFLSAASCGAAIWATTGRFSDQLKLDGSGAYLVSAERWAACDSETLSTVATALTASTGEAVARRLRNLTWAAERSWERRVARIAEFISSLP